MPLQASKPPSPPPFPPAPRSKLVQRDLRSFRARQLDRTLQARAAQRRQATTPPAPAADAIHAHLAVSPADPDLQHQVELHRAVLDSDRRDRELADEAKRNEAIAKQLDAKIKAEQRARLEREAKEREMAVEAMVDEYVCGKVQRKLVAAFNAWRHHARRTRLACIKLEARRDWHRKRAAFTHWHARMVKEIADREARKVAQELRHKEELDRRADRHWRFHALSRYFLAWTAFVALAKQERELENAHLARKRKVDQFLAHLQAKRDAMARAAAVPPAQDPRALTRDGNRSRSQTPSRSKTPSRSTPTPSSRPARLAPPLARPAFLTRMEERERERRARKAEREARHADAVERARLEAAQAELDRVERERHETQQRADEERAAAEAAERARQHAREQWQRAVAHADRAKVKYRGLRPWQRWVEVQKEARERADRWHEDRVVRWVVREWARAARARVERRMEVATRHLERVQVVQAWRAWVQFTAVHRAQVEQAENIARGHLLVETLQSWRGCAQHRRETRMAKEAADNAKADAIAARVLPRRYFAQWRAFVQQSKDDRWKEYRRTMLRNKVRSWLQDSSFERMCQEAELSSPVWATSLAHTSSTVAAAEKDDDDTGHD
ncbi:hypothetical protein AMAG_10448 [Allomyces macrogynus ATCC 38327]|uniref:Sfi1 spindle body domain-containing protein n=1 Tax=Allomyces macrogynus (strain ATCC 38327) TaxID=578462 RepID=A0A0L0SUL4_ALLM3|nr:hypothetical protein AMAG_10448 [Allomyces macrogynus ATCC 38327]|eukprot:KNE66207.1 hypothetical protein AMAG_10448 [Allomyces macrogynus ATCC 38327]